MTYLFIYGSKSCKLVGINVNSLITAAK